MTGHGTIAGSFPASACPFCRSEDLVEFSGRPAARCARCGSLERHRNLVRTQAPLLERGEGRAALEVGPLNERVFGAYLRERGWAYLSADQSRRGNPHDCRDTAFVDLEADLCALSPLADDSVDLFVAQHVIEEILDHRAALAEVARVLARDGTALLEIPFDPVRKRSHRQPPGAFGNVWAFGADLPDQVREHFAEVEQRSYLEGAFRGELLVCRRPKHRGDLGVEPARRGDRAVEPVRRGDLGVEPAGRGDLKVQPVRRGDPSMASASASRFPLLVAGDLEAARARWSAQRPGTAAAGLRDNLERVLRDRAFDAPLQLGLANNLFQAQGLLMEASLGFRLSGEERYLEPVRRCVAEVAQERVRRARLPSEIHRAFLVVGLAVAYELCGEAIEREPLQATIATIVAALHEASLREEWGDRIPKRNAWNHTAVAYAAIGCGGLLCRGLDERAPRWLDDALARIRLFFADGMTDAGMTREGLAYCGFVFRNVAPLLLACRNAGVWDYRSPRENPHVERLRRVPRWYAIEAFPGGSWLQPVNDSYWSPRRALGGFLPTFGALDPPLTAWVHDLLVGERGDGTHGQDPSLAACSLFESVLWPPGPAPSDSDVELPQVLADPVVGYVAERVREPPRGGFSFNCGEYLGGIHDQSDNGSVTLFAGAVPLLIDSGAANDPVEGSASSSHAHNVVLIDGRGQLPAGGGAGCSGSILHAERHALATVLSSDLAPAYDARGHNPVRHAIRHCVFGKHPFTYLLVVDDFCRPEAEEAVYEQLFHTPPVAWTRTQDGIEMGVGFEGEQATLAIRPLDEHATLTNAFFAQHDPDLFPEHMVWRVRRAGRHAVMPTLLLACAGDRPAEVASAFDPRGGRIALQWRVADHSGTDVLTFTPGSRAAATLTRDGRRLSPCERLLASNARAAVAGGQEPAVQSCVPSGSAGGVAPARFDQRATDPAHVDERATDHAHVDERATDPAHVDERATDHAHVDERALARRRRLRRLVESVDAFDQDRDLTGRESPVASGGLARELLELLVTLAELDPDASVLDLQCGPVHIAAPLVHYLRWGSYTGFDAGEAAVAWCREKLASRNPRFTFEHFDVRHAGHLGNGSSPVLPIQDESFELVLATSLLDSIAIGAREETGGWLKELARVLRPDGTIFLTSRFRRQDAAPGWLACDGRVDRGGRVHGLSASAQKAGVGADRVAFGALVEEAGLGMDRVAFGALADFVPPVGPDVLILRRER